jgi:hypothetical protein
MCIVATHIALNIQ